MDIYDIVLDTNIIVAGLFSRAGTSFKILSDIGLGKFNLFLSVPLLFEYEEVLKGKVKQLGLTNVEIDELLDYICSASFCIPLYFSWRPCLNDPDDEMLLELGVASNADYIVTHNIRHLKKLYGFSVRAITPGDFLKLSGGNS